MDDLGSSGGGSSVVAFVVVGGSVVVVTLGGGIYSISIFTAGPWKKGFPKNRTEITALP